MVHDTFCDHLQLQDTNYHRTLYMDKMFIKYFLWSHWIILKETGLEYLLDGHLHLIFLWQMFNYIKIYVNVFCYRLFILAMDFCQKIQSLLNCVVRKESSSLDHLHLQSEIWALKGIIVYTLSVHCEQICVSEWLATVQWISPGTPKF